MIAVDWALWPVVHLKPSYKLLQGFYAPGVDAAIAYALGVCIEPLCQHVP